MQWGFIVTNEDFRKYMMYRPANVGYGVQWVPLHRIAWTWWADVYRPGSSWLNSIIPTFLNLVVVVEDTRYKIHPIWDVVLSASAPYIP